MRIIARRSLREFVDSLSGRKDRAGVKAAFGMLGFDEARKASGEAPLTSRNPCTASIVTAERIVFTSKENAYRLV